MKIDNILLQSDSYKFSHWKQYPPKTDYVFSYIESRGGKYDKTVFFGLQAFVKEYLSKPITQEMIDEAEAIVDTHIGPGIFNREGWEYILSEHNGYLPLRIRAVQEGTVVPTRNILVSVENTDPKAYWLTSYIETALLRAVWYPTTVATNSWSIKQVIRQALIETADSTEGLEFRLHDFGARGVSSSESAGLGGMAHLVNFMGTDTVEALLYAKRYYDEPMAGFSVPAAEHSSITTWGKKGELEAYRNMLTQFGGKFPIIAVVSDSYDIFNAVEKMWGGELKDEVIGSGSTLVVRPDSGDPAEVVAKVAMLLDASFGSTVNSKGYKVLNNVRVIQGDGINEESIRGILSTLRGYGFSADNVVFGMGGALLQQVNRDTQKFAMKASAAFVDGKWIDVFKDPITDSGKHSKKGRLMLARDRNTNEMFTYASGMWEDVRDVEAREDLLNTIYSNGTIMKQYTFSDIRARVEETTKW
jgi:nicotinamide phosphoribosyltransferase